MKDLKTIAKKFASDWYARRQDGCSEATLASLLEETLNQVVQSTEIEERERIAQKFKNFIGPY